MNPLKVSKTAKYHHRWSRSKHGPRQVPFKLIQNALKHTKHNPDSLFYYTGSKRCFCKECFDKRTQTPLIELDALTSQFNKEKTANDPLRKIPLTKGEAIRLGFAAKHFKMNNKEGRIDKKISEVIERIEKGEKVYDEEFRNVLTRKEEV